MCLEPNTHSLKGLVPLLSSNVHLSSIAVEDVVHDHVLEEDKNVDLWGHPIDDRKSLEFRAHCHFLGNELLSNLDCVRRPLMLNFEILYHDVQCQFKVPIMLKPGLKDSSLVPVASGVELFVSHLSSLLE